MSDTRHTLTTALLRLGQVHLAQIWDVDASEAGRRLNGQRNIPFDDFCAALDALGIQVITPDQHKELIDAAELHALRVLAKKSLEPDGERRQTAERRQVQS